MLTLISVGTNATRYSWCIAVICFDNNNRIFINFVTRPQFQKILLVDFSLPDVHVLMFASHKQKFSRSLLKILYRERKLKYRKREVRTKPSIKTRGIKPQRRCGLAGLSSSPYSHKNYFYLYPWKKSNQKCNAKLKVNSVKGTIALTDDREML